MNAVKVQFEIGHTSKLRNKKTPEGFTHDWEIYVQGVNKDDISTFVDKVVFNLHDSFPKPKRVCKDPPYVIQESGYAGFLLPIDIFFRNRDEPKRVQFTYDLDLQHTGPPHHRCEQKNFIFESASEEFLPKLLKGGGIPVSGVISSSSSSQHNSLQTNNENVKLGSNDFSNKKHKSRLDDPKSNTFANLFGTSSTKGIPTKNAADEKSSSSGSNRTVTDVKSPTLNLSTASHTSGLSKEKLSRDKDKSSNSLSSSNILDKLKKDKPEKREKHKQSSPHKDSRGDLKKSSTNTISKHDKRSEEKIKKDRSRDKEKERNREKVSSSSSGSKQMTSPKMLREADIKSPKASQIPQSHSTRSLPVTERMEDKKLLKSKQGESNKQNETKAKDQSTSSTGKKSKKEKKDKDRDREREKQKREDYKEKRSSDSKVKEERLDSNTSINEKNSKICLPKEAGSLKEIKVSPNLNQSSKNKDIKTNVSKSKAFDKPNEKDLSQEKKCSINNVIERDKKSHKHKKKDKTKDKEKDKDRDKEKDKDKNKEERLKEKDKQKTNDKLVEKSVDTNGGPIVEQTTDQRASTATPTENKSTNALIVNSGTIVNSSSSTPKKSQIKDKKPKDKSTKEEKGLHDISESESKEKCLKMNTVSSEVRCSKQSENQSNQNIDMINADSLSSTLETQQLILSKQTPVTVTLQQNSDGSNSSFLDSLQDKRQTHSRNSQISSAPTKNAKQIDSSIPIKKEKKSSSTITSRTECKQPINEKISKIGTENKLEKSNKQLEKDEKKRRRNQPTNNHFVQPPIKQFKKDQTNIGIEKSKSPNLRNIIEQTSGSDASAIKGGFLTPAKASNTSPTAPIPAASSVSASSTETTTTNNAHVTQSAFQPSSPQHASVAVNNETGSAPTTTNIVALPNEYLGELQELHHKIMTLQDNEELQQVVEMIAATGCYEITSKTFDFDLCKLDRSTVQRLQDFFATSVS